MQIGLFHYHDRPPRSIYDPEICLFRNSIFSIFSTVNLHQGIRDINKPYQIAITCLPSDTKWFGLTASFAQCLSGLAFAKPYFKPILYIISSSYRSYVDLKPNFLVTNLSGTFNCKAFSHTLQTFENLRLPNQNLSPKRN